jgi:hypothetical protein
MIQDALDRKPLSKNQWALLKALVAAAPNWLDVDQLADRAGLDRSKPPGILGGLGLRFATAPGWPRQKGVRPTRFVIEHRDFEGVRQYRATTALCEAVAASQNRQ